VTIYYPAMALCPAGEPGRRSPAKVFTALGMLMIPRGHASPWGGWWPCDVRLTTTLLLGNQLYRLSNGSSLR